MRNLKARIREQREAHSAHKDYGALQTAINIANAKTKQKKQDINSNLELKFEPSLRAAQYGGLKTKAGQLREAANEVASLKNKIDTSTKEHIESVLRKALGEAESASSDLFGIGSDIQRQLSEAKRALDNAKDAFQRIKAGRALLDTNVQTLLRELHDEGLKPVPVCDLVRITDASWQPVIESYLGPNVQALLVPSTEETKAYGIYRRLSGSRTLYGVKIARESRQKLDRSPTPGSVAELIEGDNQAAVAYLRSKLGNLKRADTDSEALEGQKTLTKDGMLMSGDDFERLRPVSPNNLRIGAGGASHREAIQKEITDRSGEVNRLDRSYEAVTTLLESMRRIANKDLGTKFVTITWTEMISARNEAVDKTTLMKGAADKEYVKLGEVEKEWETTITKLESRQQELLQAIGSTKNALSGCQEDERLKKEQADRAISIAEEARQHKEYDLEFATKQWDTCAEKVGRRYKDMVTYFDDQLSATRRRIDRAISDGKGEMGRFLERYKEPAPPEVNEDWTKAREWINDLLRRLNDTELVPYKEEMDRAYKTSQDTFRNDVAGVLNENIDLLEATMDRLNTSLLKCPAFTNGERYQFRRVTRPKYAGLLKFVKDIAASGT